MNVHEPELMPVVRPQRPDPPSEAERLEFWLDVRIGLAVGLIASLIAVAPFAIEFYADLDRSRGGIASGFVFFACATLCGTLGAAYPGFFTRELLTQRGKTASRTIALRAVGAFVLVGGLAVGLFVAFVIASLPLLTLFWLLFRV